jgi:carbon monoxide dehydrogenase subunit G
MELQGERLIPASIDATWAALNDPAVLKACIAGCESVERTADDTFAAVVAVKVGPVGARFKGKLQMTNVQAPKGYTINFDGQGGVAGFGKGSADVALEAQGVQTLLKYAARATVGGKMAQVGSRLIDAAAGKITDDFFKAFEAHLREGAPPSRNGSAAEPAQAPPVPAAGRRIAGQWWWWLAGVLVLLAIAFFLIR